jgi:molybdate transport system regulatory protein
MSARSVCPGTIRKVVRGPVSTEVSNLIARGIEMVSVITTHPAKRLKLKKGAAAVAVVKADSVLIAVD